MSSTQSRRSEAAINKNRHPCMNCKNQKLGCAGGTPCLRCEKRGIQCIKSAPAPVEVSRLRRNSTTSGHIGPSPGAERGAHWIHSSPEEMQNSLVAAADSKHGKQVGFQHPHGPSQPQYAPAGFPQGSQVYTSERRIVDTFSVGTEINSSVVTIYDLRGERYVSTTDLDEHGRPLPLQKPDITLEEYLHHMKLAGGVANQAYAGASRSLPHPPPYPDVNLNGSWPLDSAHAPPPYYRPNFGGGHMPQSSSGYHR